MYVILILQIIFVILSNKGEKTMADYKKMYYKLFNAVTDAIEILKK